MTEPLDALYFGMVAHTRVRPVAHSLRYRVFTLLLDCDRLAALDRRMRLFSYNRPNLFSLYDRDHNDGTPIPSYLKGIAHEAGFGKTITRVLMLGYPRIFGFVFNPLTVYFGLDDSERIRLIIYEVNNTFGERKSYVLPAEPDEQGLVWQQCPKELFVSPFNKVEGEYSFHLTPLGEDFTLGVALKGPDGPIMRAHFRGRREDLTDMSLLRALFRTGWMTAKVIAGIHWEAMKLWLKGLQLQRRPPPPDGPITVHKTAKRKPAFGSAEDKAA